MAIVEALAIKEATDAFAKVCHEGKTPETTVALIEAIVKAVLKQVKAGDVSTAVTGSCSTGAVAGKGTGKIA